MKEAADRVLESFHNRNERLEGGVFSTTTVDRDSRGVGGDMRAYPALGLVVLLGELLGVAVVTRVQEPRAPTWSPSPSRATSSWTSPSLTWASTSRSAATLEPLEGVAVEDHREFALGVGIELLHRVKAAPEAAEEVFAMLLLSAGATR